MRWICDFDDRNLGGAGSNGLRSWPATVHAWNLRVVAWFASGLVVIGSPSEAPGSHRGDTAGIGCAALPLGIAVVGGGDIPQIVADEYLVFPVSMIGLASIRRPWMFLIAFALFRLFDALKLPPLNLLEAVGGGLGIVLDDLMAAVYSWIVIAVAIRLWRWFCKKQAI